MKRTTKAMSPSAIQDSITPEPARSEARFRRVFEHFNDALLIIDPATDKILDTNPRAYRMLGYSLEELLSMPLSAIYPEEIPALRCFAESVLVRDSACSDELYCLTKSENRSFTRSASREGRVSSATTTMSCRTFGLSGTTRAFGSRVGVPLRGLSLRASGLRRLRATPLARLCAVTFSPRTTTRP